MAVAAKPRRAQNVKAAEEAVKGNGKAPMTSNRKPPAAKAEPVTPSRGRNGKVETAAPRRKGKEMNYTVTLCVGGNVGTQFEVTGPLTAEQAKVILGWQPAQEGEAIFTDLEGVPIQLTRNMSNRPFRMPYAKRYMNDILRRKWSMNGEQIVVDLDENVQSGQHRLVALVLAEQARKKEPEKWDQYWTDPKLGPQPVTIECSIFQGISNDKDVINTLDIGQKRSLGDVLFIANKFPKKLPYKKRQMIANTLAGAARLVWLRSQAHKVSDAPQFPISEAVDFVDEHPGLVDSVSHIWAEEGGDAADGRQISRYISLPYAAGLHYLMAVSGTMPEDYQQKGPDALSFALKDRADMFWTMFATGKLGKKHPITVLKELLKPQEASSGRGRDAILTMVVKAFNFYLDEQDVNPEDIEAQMEEDPETGRWKLAEDVRLGGMDVSELTVFDETGQPVEEGEQEELPPDSGEVDEAERDGTGEQYDEGGEGVSEDITDDRIGKRKGKEWAKGDTAWVYDEQNGHWFGTVQKVTKAKGNEPASAVVRGDDDTDYVALLDDLSEMCPYDIDVKA